VVQFVHLEVDEHTWETGSGALARGFAFNGHVPGPTIEASTGDTLVVRFVNGLPEPSGIHWHGLRHPAETAVGTGADPVHPGGTREYRFDLPDAGTFWYHALAAGSALRHGAYGAVIVRDVDEPARDDRLLVLGTVGPDRGGRETVLVNGVAAPHMLMTAGATERWRLVHAAGASALAVTLVGQPVTVIGGDGGLLAAPRRTDEVLLAPGQRVDLLVGPLPEGRPVPVLARPLPPPAGSRPARRLATVHVAAAARAAGVASPEPAVLGRGIRPLAAPGAPPTRTVPLGAVPRTADAPVQVGGVQVWDLVNDTDRDRSFHLHGFYFQVLSVDGVPPEQLSWADTHLVTARGRARIAWLPDDRPGRWTYHVLALGQADTDGRTAAFDVLPAPKLGAAGASPRPGAVSRSGRTG
jgi:bilirubin oxidase